MRIFILGKGKREEENIEDYERIWEFHLFTNIYKIVTINNIVMIVLEIIGGTVLSDNLFCVADMNEDGIECCS